MAQATKATRRDWGMLARRTQSLLGWLLIGAVFNVLVVWGIAASSPTIKTWRGQVGLKSDATLQPWPEGWRDEERRVLVETVGRDVAIRIQARRFIPGLHETGAAAQLEWRTGYPMRSLWNVDRAHGWWPDEVSAGVNYTIAGPGIGGLFEVGPEESRQRLPIRPLPLGFVVNTALYAALAWTCAVGMRTARARLRRRLGGCAQCGYSKAGLRSGAVCPECGRA
ncbi:MAG: hypothetical protein K2Q20_14835 [Phycisphaerales bacterium]|nr:hypothetical protein [Phycisphaerales bacterium]